MSPAKQADGSSSTRVTKRGKITLACSECRLRKVKCDGVYPACGACRRRSGAACRYVIEPERKRGLGNCVATLEKRLQALEQANSVLEMQNANIQSANQQSLAQTTGDMDLSLSSDQQMNGLHSRSHSHALEMSYNLTQSPIPVTGQQNISGIIAPELNHLMDGNHASSHSPPYPGSIHDGCQGSKPVETESNSSGDDETVDGVNSMMGPVEDTLSDPDFYGSSSVAGFFKQVKSAVDHKACAPEITITSLVWPERPLKLMSSPKGTNESIHAKYSLPPRKMADRLLELFWSKVFPLYPYLDQEHVQAEYNKVWLGETLDSDESIFLSILNVIFALSCQLSNFIKAEERQSSAKAFFSRARGLLQFSLWNTGSLDMIQCLLLMAQYLQSTDSAHQCWLLTGNAVRHAQGLGLHMPETIRRLQSPREQEIATRVWQGCVMMDRVVGMTFGRPTMVSDASSKLAISMAGRLVKTDDTEQRCSELSLSAFFTHSLGLYEIAHDIIVQLYRSQSEFARAPTQSDLLNQDSLAILRTVFEFENDLTKWLRMLPQHLRQPSIGPTTDPAFSQQSIILKIRFLHVRILLFRPVLLADLTRHSTEFCNKDTCPEHCLQHQIAHRCSLTCIKVAQELIELIYINTPTDESVGLLPAWWYNALYVYTAATVLVAARLRSSILVELTEPGLTQSWKYATDVLQECQKYSPSVSRYRTMLEVLHDAANSGTMASKLSLGQHMQNSGQYSMTEALSNPLAEVLCFSGLDDMDISYFQDAASFQQIPDSVG